MAHPLTHLTHGIPTRRPFHPAKTASAWGVGAPRLHTLERNLPLQLHYADFIIGVFARVLEPFVLQFLRDGLRFS